MTYGNKKTVLIGSFAMLVSSCFFHRKEKSSDAPIQDSCVPFFASVPVTFSSVGMPYIEVKIGDEILSMNFDLGFQGDLSIPHPLINSVFDKEFAGAKSMYGFRGLEHEVKLYRIAKAVIGPITVTNPILQEWTEKARNDSILMQDETEQASYEGSGLVGWKIFSRTKLLLDIKNGEIAICDSLETLEKRGYHTKEFIETPLHIDRGLVEIRASTAEGILNCVLDTGSTINILNTEIGETKRLEEVMWEPSTVFELESLTIAHQEFGPVKFHRIPIKLPIHIEAILGIDFFQNHLVFLDFQENKAYFSKYIENDKVFVKNR